MLYETAVQQSLGSRQLAIESEVLGNMVQSVAKFFPSLYKDFVEGSSKYFDDAKAWVHNPSKIVALTKQEADLLKEVDSVPFDEMSNFRVPCPEGFKGNLVSYTTLLLEDKNYFYDQFAPALENFYVILASIATNKDARMSLRDDAQAYKKMASQRQARDSAQRKFFPSSNHETSVKFPIAFNDAGQLADYYAQLDQLSTHNHKQMVDMVKAKITAIGAVITSLVSMAEDGSIKNITPEVVKSLHAGTYELASQIEFFAVYLYRCNAILNTREELDAKLKGRF